MDRERLTPKECIDLIHHAGGLAVMAHPCFLYRKNKKKLVALLEELKEHHLDGLETYYSEHTEQETITFFKLARKLELMVSGGSDFHGDNKPYIKMAFGRGNLRIPRAIVHF